MPWLFWAVVWTIAGIITALIVFVGIVIIWFLVQMVRERKEDRS